MRQEPSVLFIWFIVLMNAAAFLAVRGDKLHAQRKQRRIRERTLFLLALLGGGVGLYAAMLIFRHKTKHKSFMLGVPAIMLGELIVYIILTKA